MHDRAATRATILVADAVIGTVKKAGPAGAPLDLIYAILSEHISCNHSQLEALISALEAIGCIRRTGDLAFYVPWPRPAFV
jgi:hypothetical protein